jgi:acyl-CoA thioesterase FadM
MHFAVSEYVRWEDIDAAGIINYQAYLRFFGLAETELLRTAASRTRSCPRSSGCGCRGCTWSAISARP